MKNAIVSIAVFVLVASGIRLAIKGASYTDAENKVKSGQTYQAPTDFKAGVLNGCISSPDGTEANRGFCQCTVDYLSLQYGDVRFQAIALEYLKTNVAPTEMVEAVNHCVGKYVKIEKT